MGVRLDALVDELLLEVAGTRRRGLGGLAARRLDGRGRDRLWLGLGCLWLGLVERSLRLGKNLFGKVEVGRALDRLRVVGAGHDAPALDPLERE